MYALWVIVYFMYILYLENINVLPYMHYPYLGLCIDRVLGLQNTSRKCYYHSQLPKKKLRTGQYE